jgi:cytoskeletal protein CcmA (bactofilin family)
MGWYSTPFNYDGTSPTQVRDDLQKANENFQALSDVFENGTPLSGRIKSSYIPGGGGNIGGDIVVNSVTISNPNRVNLGIDLSASTGGFYQAAIKMPVGVPGSMIGWIPATGTWGADSLIGVNTSGQFWVIGRPGSDGRKQVRVSDDLYVTGSLIPGSISVLPSSSQNYALNLRSSAGFTQGCILMPTGGIGSQITWGDPPDGNSLIGIQFSTNRFVIIGKPDNTGRNKIYMSDDVNITGNLVVAGTITGNVVYQVPDTITLKKINVNADVNQDYGISFRGSNGFSQSAILMPTGGNGSFINWGNTNPYDCLVGISSSLGQFIIAGKSDGTARNVDIYDNLRVHGYTTSVGFTLNATSTQDYGINLRNSVGFNKGAVLMPTSGNGAQISWGDPPDGSSLIGVQASSGHFVIIGRADPAYGNRRTIYMSDDIINVGNTYINGNLSVSGTISGNIQIPDTITVKRINVNAGYGSDYGINFRNSINFTIGCILMPTSGSGTQISWGDPPDSNGLIGRQYTTGRFVIIGLPTGTNGTPEIYMQTNVFVSGTITQGSDLSMKENIVPFSDSALDLIKNIDVYKYLLKESKEEHIGFVANYVKDVFPYGVTINAHDGTCSVNILDMLALLFKAVKELAEYVANN